MTARQTAFTALCRMDEGEGYSNLVLDAVLKGSGLSGADAALASALFYGVLERRMTLDFLLDSLSDRRKKPSVKVRTALRMGAYQILYMDRVPDRAAVNETVALLKTEQPSAAGFANAVLRRLSSEKKERLCFDALPETERLALECSVPSWLVQNISADYGRESAAGFLRASLDPPPVYLRANTLRITAEELAAALAEEGQTPLPTLLPGALRLDRPGDLQAGRCFREGLFYVEDLASQLCIEALDPKPGERVLDLCAAPGGKSFAAALRMHDQGEMLSCDLHAHRCRLIESGRDRLGLSCIRTRCHDAVSGPPETGFDRVLCDVPCSGFGIIRRKPEIKYKNPEHLKGLPALQFSILESGAAAVRPGGRLIYSTCTLRRSENQRVTARFLAGHPEFEAIPIALPGVDSATDDGCLTLMGQQDTDGFFVAAFCRKDAD